MRFGQVCKMTLRPLRWTSNPRIVTKRCLVGECETCNRRYVGKGHTNGLYQGQDLWANEYSLCFNTLEDELLDYGTYEDVK